MGKGWGKEQIAVALFGVLLLSGPSFAAAPVIGGTSAPVTLRCTLNGAGDTFTQYFTVDPAQKTVSSSGDLYRVGNDPSGGTGRVITRWSDTEITLVNEEWIRNGWQRFRIVTVLDRLTGAIRSEDLNGAYNGSCTIADTAKKLF